MSFIDELKTRVLLFDGAMGTFLQNEGLPLNACPEEWNISHPEIVKKIHKSYFDAGSDVVETNSFGGSKLKLEKYGFADRTYEINKKAAELAKEVCPVNKFVAGSIGPTGEMLEPFGDFTADQIYDAYLDQVKGLRDGGVDVFCIETMMDIGEAKIAIKAAKENSNLPIITSMTFNKTPNGFKTLMGSAIENVAFELKAAGAHIIGSNCGTGINDMIDILKEFKSKIKDMYFIIQPNAGLPVFIDGKLAYTETPEIMSSRITELLSIGVNIIGGCCGTTPEHIKSFKKSILK